MASLEHYPLIHNNQFKGIDATLGEADTLIIYWKYSDLNIIGLDQDHSRENQLKNLMSLKIGLI